jgi:hypothetical protein
MNPLFSLACVVLFAYTELAYDLTVTVQIDFLEVLQMATPLPDHLEETPARMMILLVRLQVLRQVADTPAQQRYLHFRRTRVRRMPAIGTDYTGLLLFIHNRTLLSCSFKAS